MPSARRWQSAPPNDRHTTLVRNFMAALTAGTLMFCSARSATFMADLENFFQAHGRWFYRLSLHMGTNGNKLAMWGFILLNALYWVPLTIAFALATRYLVRYVSGGDSTSPGSGSSPRGGLAAAMRPALSALTFMGVLHTIMRIAFPNHVLAGDCTSEDQCICYPSGSDPGVGPIGPLINWPLIPLTDGNPYDPEKQPFEPPLVPKKSPADFAKAIRDAKKEFEEPSEPVEDRCGRHTR